MAGADLIRYMCKESGTQIKDLAVAMDCPYQSLRNKLFRDTFPFKEVEYIADLLGFDIAAIKREAEQDVSNTEQDAQPEGAAND